MPHPLLHPPLHLTPVVSNFLTQLENILGVSVHIFSNLTDAEKLTYLRHALIKNGSAKSVVEDQVIITMNPSLV